MGSAGSRVIIYLTGLRGAIVAGPKEPAGGVVNASNNVASTFTCYLRWRVTTKDRWEYAYCSYLRKVKGTVHLITILEMYVFI